MAAQAPTATLDQETADRLSAGLHRCFSDFEADEDLRARHAAEAPLLRP